MKDLRNKTIRGIISTAITCTILFTTLFLFLTEAYAWFSSNQKANVSGASIRVDVPTGDEFLIFYSKPKGFDDDYSTLLDSIMKKEELEDKNGDPYHYEYGSNNSNVSTETISYTNWLFGSSLSNDGNVGDDESFGFEPGCRGEFYLGVKTSTGKSMSVNLHLQTDLYSALVETEDGHEKVSNVKKVDTESTSYNLIRGHILFFYSIGGSTYELINPMTGNFSCTINGDQEISFYWYWVENLEDYVYEFHTETVDGVSKITAGKMYNPEYLPGYVNGSANNPTINSTGAIASIRAAMESNKEYFFCQSTGKVLSSSQQTNVTNIITRFDNSGFTSTTQYKTIKKYFDNADLSVCNDTNFVMLRMTQA